MKNRDKLKQALRKYLITGGWVRGYNVDIIAEDLTVIVEQYIKEEKCEQDYQVGDYR